MCEYAVLGISTSRNELGDLIINIILNVWQKISSSGRLIVVVSSNICIGCLSNLTDCEKGRGPAIHWTMKYLLNMKDISPSEYHVLFVVYLLLTAPRKHTPSAILRDASRAE